MQNQIELANPCVSERPADARTHRLMTKCYGSMNQREGPYEGEADV